MNAENKTKSETSIGTTSSSGEQGLRQKSERLRRRLFRANSAVAVILVTVSCLALVAVLASVRAVRNQRRAEQAERGALEKLWHSHLDHARALQLSGRMGRRFEGLEAIKAATQIRPSPELRNEAIAFLTMLDLQETTNVWAIRSPIDVHTFDAQVDRYVTADNRGSLWVFRMADNQELMRLHAAVDDLPLDQQRCVGLQFSPDGRYLVERFSGGAVFLWDLSLRRTVFQSIPPPILTGWRFANFSPDSRYLGFADYKDGTKTTVVDVNSGQIVKSMKARIGSVFEFRPGQPVLAFRLEKRVELWNWATEELLQVFPLQSAVRSFVWSNSGKLLAVACADGQMHLWDPDLGTSRVLSGHSATVDFELFNHDDSLLTSVGFDGAWRLWDPASGRLLLTGTHGEGTAFSEDGKRIGFERQGKIVGTWRIERGQGFRALSVREAGATQIRGLTLSADGRWLVAASELGLHFWDLSASQRAHFVPMKGVLSLDLSPDGQSLVWSSPTNLLQCEFRDALAGGTNPIHTMELLRFPSGFTPFCVAFSPDMRRVAAISRDARTALLDRAAPQDWKWLSAAPGVLHVSGSPNPPGARYLAFSPDGLSVANGLSEAGPTIWDAANGKVAFTLTGINGTVSFSPDGRRLLVGGYDDYEWWDMADRLQPHRVSREGDGATHGVSALNASQGWMATVHADQTIRLASLATGTELAAFTTPDEQTLSGLCISSSGAVLAAPTRRDAIYVWDLPELRRGLASLNLDWNDATNLSVTANPAQPLQPSGRTGWTAVGLATHPLSLSFLGLVAASVAAFAGLVVLGRHRRLAGEFLQAEELVSQRERELRLEQEVGQLKSHFVATVSHEFRTPLGIILSSTDILRKYFNRLSEERRNEHLTDIMESVGNMKDLMESVLLLGRVEAGKVECRPASLDIVAQSGRAVSDVTATTHSRCPIELESSPFEGSAILDATLVQIILTNLLSNAVKYSPEHSPVGLLLRRDGRDAVFEVTDEGIGIPAADHADLFESFHRARNVGSVPGSGLGLTIVKRCVDLHNGSITFVSAEGRGATFTVRLPAFRS